MTNNKVLFNMTDKCDIHFESSLITKERIITKYADFLATSLSSEGHSVSVALHTGSVCFDVISFVMAALACVSYNETDSESIITSLNEKDIVLFRNERHRWCGLEIRDGKRYMVLERDGWAKNGNITSSVPFDINKNLIKPYYGSSDITDGRGIKRENTNRVDFISHIFGIPTTEVPSVTGVSTVIVTERNTFDRLSKGLHIVYGNGKKIGLLDIVTASYYTDSGEEYQCGSNPAKTEPVLKVTGKVSTARDLALDKQGNKTVGLMVIGTSVASKGGSELTDLLARKSLKFAHVALEIDSECAEDIIKSQEDPTIFACTKEFLVQNASQSKVSNPLTFELEKQIENIIKNVVTPVIVDGGYLWDDIRKARESLYIIKKSEWEERVKNNFVITAHSLLNLFTTAVFPIEVLELAINEGRLTTVVSSPSLRIGKLWELVDSSKYVGDQCAYVTKVLERLYQHYFSNCPKHKVLKQLLGSTAGQRVAVIVPKTYYVDLLREDETIKQNGITLVTANRFDNSGGYDKIIVVGDFSGKRFDPFKCRAAADITVLLYESETYFFEHKMRKAKIFKDNLNYRLGVFKDDALDTDSVKVGSEDKDVAVLADEELDLEKYIEKIIAFDIEKIAAKVSSSTGNTLTSEVCAIGRFNSGEQILFSKYYNPFVFDAIKGIVIETNVEDLLTGDQLVFAKRDDYTRNMVDYIYENLLKSGHLNAMVIDATEKTAYWKEALREYKQKHSFSYRDISRGLQNLGSSLQEVSIRQWLDEESHIVGPRDELTMNHIAELTQDPYLLEDTQSYVEACRIVRRQRKEILELIGKAIADKLSGHKPATGSILEIVYDNVENLSKILELDGVSLLDKPIFIPINLINKPILDWEVNAE